MKLWTFSLPDDKKIDKENLYVSIPQQLSPKSLIIFCTYIYNSSRLLATVLPAEGKIETSALYRDDNFIF